MSMALQPDWVNAKRTALVIIDCQVDFAAPDGEMARRGVDLTTVQAAVIKIEALADAARAGGVTRIFTRLLSKPDEQSANEREARARFGKEDEPALCMDGTHGADFVGPQPGPGDLVFAKQRFSAFPGSGLAEALASRGLDTLVLCGLTTECCVQSSAWDAFERDLHVFVAADACAAYDEGLHRAALESLGLSGAVLVGAADFHAAWKR